MLSCDVLLLGLLPGCHSSWSEGVGRSSTQLASRVGGCVQGISGLSTPALSPCRPAASKLLTWPQVSIWVPVMFHLHRST